MSYHIDIEAKGLLPAPSIRIIDDTAFFFGIVFEILLFQHLNLD